MKKFLSILMVLAMILAMSTTAFAAEEAVNYKAFKLLNVTSSLKTTDHPAHDSTVEHTDDCYNYRYTFNPVYENILKTEVTIGASVDFWPNSTVPAPKDVTIDQVSDYLDNHTSDDGTSYGSIRQVADRIYKDILAAHLDADLTAESMEALLAALGEDKMGYWMIADVRNLDGATDEANALVVLDTRGELPLDININTKISYPTVEKRVKDIEDSEQQDISARPWWVSADHDIGDDIYFKVASTLPNNMRAYDEYTLVFHDTMDSALSLNAGSIRVVMYDTHNAAHVDTNMRGGTEIPAEYYEIKTENLDDGCSFEVEFPNVKDIPNITNDSTIVVYYTAKLTDNGVKYGAEGNKNEAYIEYSNNPYDKTSTGKTEEVNVLVFTYKLVVNKTDSFGVALKGAEFTLYKEDLRKVKPDSADPMERQGFIVVDQVVVDDENQTTFEWLGLDDGDYILKETQVPDGYNGMKDIAFSITASHTEATGEPALTGLSSGDLNGSIDDIFSTITANIENKAGAVLPETGAEGTFFLITGGTLLVLVAAVFMITRKKMSIYED